MKELRTIYPIELYLRATPEIDFDHEEIRSYIAEYRPQERADVEIARDTFEFVRDRIAHSYDINSRTVTRKASGVLIGREGICYAKSLLLAALLRGMGVPSGFCYQRLKQFDTPESDYCVHALNTVYLKSDGKWIRLDARGNKPGVDAQFSLGEERLAFPIRPEFGELDYPFNYPEPHPKITATLAAHDDCLEMYLHHLPTNLDQR